MIKIMMRIIMVMGNNMRKMSLEIKNSKNLSNLMRIKMIMSIKWKLNLQIRSLKVILIIQIITFINNSHKEINSKVSHQLLIIKMWKHKHQQEIRFSLV